MNYTAENAENIDIEAFESALEDRRNRKRDEKIVAIKQAESYFQGYEDAIEAVAGMLHCANYESTSKKSKSFSDGADYAFYELCKELDISCQDIRDIDISVDEKASMIADRIKSFLVENNGID